MTQPQACTGMIRLLPSPRCPFWQIDCLGRGASQVLGSLFLRRGPHARQNNEWAQTRGFAAEHLYLLAWHKPFFRFNPSPIWLAQITLCDLQMHRLNADWLGLPLIGRAVPQSQQVLSGARHVASYDQLRLRPTAVISLRIEPASFRT